MHSNRYKRASTRIAKRNKIKKYISIFFRMSIPIVLLVGFIFLVRADFLKVADFEVVDSRVVVVEDMKRVAIDFTSGNKLLFIPRSNILFLNKEKLKQTILSQFTRLEDIAINKKFFSQSLELKVVERSGDFLWCDNSDECFFMTKSGFIFEKTLEGQASSSLIAFGGLLEGNPLLKNFTTPEKMQNYINFIETLKKGGVEVVSINIEFSDKAIAKTNIGDIFFSPAGEDLLLVGENTILLIRDIREKNPSAQIDYIDARFGNKFYYKLD